MTDTGVIAHEAGHHLGLSHVHDTYDPVLDADVSSADGGEYWFMIVGTETYTAMSYLPNTDEFGQFDRDHMARWQVAARLDNANRILGDVARSPRSGKAASRAGQADARAGQAVALLNEMGPAAARPWPRPTPKAWCWRRRPRPTSRSSRSPGSPTRGPGRESSPAPLDPRSLALQPSPADLSRGPVRLLP